LCMINEEIDARLSNCSFQTAF